MKNSNPPSIIPYKKQRTLQERIAERTTILEKHPDHIPIVCERSAKATSLPISTKIKYLVPNNINSADFIHILRQRIKLAPEQAMFLIVNSKIISGTQPLSAIYEKNKDIDGFLYITYAGENTFGCYTTSKITTLEKACDTTELP